MIDAAAKRPAELLPLRARLRGARTIDEGQNEQTINNAGRSTYPNKKSVLRTEATRVLLGGGERLFEGIDLRALGYECVRFVASEKATHVVLRRQGDNGP